MKKITREKFFESIKPYLALIVLTIVFAIGTGGQSLSHKKYKNRYRTVFGADACQYRCVLCDDNWNDGSFHQWGSLRMLLYPC